MLLNMRVDVAIELTNAQAAALVANFNATRGDALWIGLVAQAPFDPLGFFSASIYVGPTVCVSEQLCPALSLQRPNISETLFDILGTKVLGIGVNSKTTTARFPFGPKESSIRLTPRSSPWTCPVSARAPRRGIRRQRPDISLPRRGQRRSDSAFHARHH